MSIGPNFSAGCWEIQWRYRTDPERRDWSQIDASNPDEAVAVLRDGDDGYNRIGRIDYIRRRRELEPKR
jgi:hypothetical protein